MEPPPVIQYGGHLECQCSHDSSSSKGTMLAEHQNQCCTAYGVCQIRSTVNPSECGNVTYAYTHCWCILGQNLSSSTLTKPIYAGVVARCCERNGGRRTSEMCTALQREHDVTRGNFRRTLARHWRKHDIHLKICTALQRERDLRSGESAKTSMLR